MHEAQRLGFALEELGCINSTRLQRLFTTFFDPQGIYVVSNGLDNERSTTARGAELHRSCVWGVSPKLYVSGNGPISGYTGFDANRDLLVREGIDRKDIVPIFGSAYQDAKQVARFNTATEADATVRYFKENHIDRVVVVAWPMHLPRTMITFVTAALKEYPELNMVFLPGLPVSLSEEISASQGEQRGNRVDVLLEELEKALAYDNLIDPAQVIEYFKARNQRLGWN